MDSRPRSSLDERANASFVPVSSMNGSVVLNSSMKYGGQRTPPAHLMSPLIDRRYAPISGHESPVNQLPNACEPCDAPSRPKACRDYLWELVQGNRRYVAQRDGRRRGENASFIPNHAMDLERSALEMLTDDPLRPVVAKAIVVAATRRLNTSLTRSPASCRLFATSATPARPMMASSARASSQSRWLKPKASCHTRSSYWATRVTISSRKLCAAP